MVTAGDKVYGIQIIIQIAHALLFLLLVNFTHIY